MKDNNKGTHSMKKFNVLCIGDIMLDQFIYGEVSRISPEAPVPVLLKSDSYEMLGGVGNLAMNLSSLNVKTSVISMIGNDDFGHKISNLLEKYKIDNYLIRNDCYKTITKTRFIAKNHHLLRMDSERKIEVNLDDNVKAVLKKYIANSHAVIISDYAKGFITHAMSQFVINEAKNKSIPIFVDPKGKEFSKYQYSSFIKPNLHEFNIATDSNISPNDPEFLDVISHKADSMIEKYRLKGLIITLGEFGILYYEKRQDQINRIWKKSYAKEVYDVSGAGDTTLAAFVCSYMNNNLNIDHCLDFANAAAGLVVSKRGTATVTISEITNYLSLSDKL